MKNNLENAFRESLKDYQAPYNPEAWEAVNAKLDARAAAETSGSSVSNILKWTAASVLAAGLIFGAYYSMTNNGIETNSNPSKLEANNNKLNKNNERQSVGTPFNEDADTQESQHHLENTITTDQSEAPQVAHEDQLDKTETSAPIEGNEEVGTYDNEGGISNDNEMNQNNTFTSSNESNNSHKFIAGRVSMLDICEGEKVVVSNPTKNRKVKFEMDDGQNIILKAGQSYVFKPKSSSKINFLNEDNSYIATEEITVHNVPSVNFAYEANIFEKGLPVVLCEAYGEYASYAWTFDGKIAKKGAESLHHFFKKGDHEVALKVIDRNGCENTIKKKINIRNNYNLMAVDAFRPNGSDSRNQTFMPYSLTERDVKFQLTIVDPTDKGIVFTSKDAKRAWDGTDQRTGEMTSSNKTFIWKVQIFNPVPNERPIYSGTIVHD